MEICRFSVGDTVETKKAHPCGSKLFTVLYSGSDIKLRCQGCGKEIISPRIKIEKNIKKTVSVKK